MSHINLHPNQLDKLDKDPRSTKAEPAAPSSGEVAAREETTDRHRSHKSKSGNIDLGSPEYCRCLSSEELVKIKDSFIESLPSSDDIYKYSASLLDLVSDTSSGKQTPDKKHDTQSESDSVQNIFTSTISALGFSSLTKTVITAAASLLNSVAGLKDLLSSGEVNKETLTQARESLATIQGEFLDAHSELQKTSPEEAKRLDASFRPINLAITKLTDKLDECQENICKMNECAQHNGTLSEEQKEEFAKALQDALSEIDQLKKQIEFYTKKRDEISQSTAPLQDRHEEISKVAEGLSDVATEVKTSMQTHFKKFVSLAEATGVSTLISQIREIASSSIENLNSWHQKYTRRMSAWVSGIVDGWERGLSLEHYIQNPISNFASVNNQLDLDELRTKYIESNRSIYNFDLYINNNETSKDGEVIPEGFKRVMELNPLSRGIINPTFSRDNIEKENESKKQKKDYDRYKQNTGIEPTTDISGEMSNADKMKNLLNRYFNN